MTIAPEILKQVESITVHRGTPLLICDADEVLLQFARALESFLEDNGYYFDVSSFALTGNIRRQSDDTPIDGTQVRDLISAFFADRAELVPAVPGAAEALNKLATRAQIIIVSNIPLAQREARIRGLTRQEMQYPLVANSGGKGAVVRRLAEQVDAPVLFMDDIPQNISSVAEAANDVHRIHFIADPRLAALLGPAEDCHHRIDDWPGARAYIEDHLALHGF